MPGQRLLTVQIESDGKVVYEGIRGVPDNTPVVEMWDVLDDVPFKPTTTKNNGAENDTTNRVTLEGAVVVRIKHVNRELANAALEELTFRHNKVEATWSLDAAEVARIKRSVDDQTHTETEEPKQ